MGTQYSVESALYKIQELLSQGYSENDIYLVTNDRDDFETLNGSTDAEVILVHGENWRQKFDDFMNGKFEDEYARQQMGFSLQQAKTNFIETSDGGVLFFVTEQDTDRKDEMDSGVEIGENGQMLDSFDEKTLVVNDNGNYPRINTTNL
ncbi:hypothetical protein AU377_03135 [Sporosarcina sp. HYO08]|nr:hypothetical protein AU377_03135 [Sporosarcina sp. HYO08]